MTWAARRITSMKNVTTDPNTLVITRGLRRSSLHLEGFRKNVEDCPRTIYLPGRREWTKAYTRMVRHELAEAVERILSVMDHEAGTYDTV